MHFLVIEGNIGAGKTSLAKMIGNRVNAKVILEQFSENPFLPGFYKDPARYAFPLEMSFLAGRYNQIRREMPEPDLLRTFAVSDYYFFKSLIFSKSTLSGDEYKLFRQLFDIMNSSVPVPDLYVYLHREPVILLENIIKRGRAYERGITKDYLLKIQQSYFDFMEQMEELSFLVIDLGESDFMSGKDVFEIIIEKVFAREYPSGINRLGL